MGIDTKVHLPENVRINDVMSVIGVAVGCPVTMKEFSSGGGRYAKVDCIGFNSTHAAEMVEINFYGRHCSYFFEPEDGGRMVYSRSTPFWIAVAKRLVDFFGGYADFNDCDDIDIDYQVEPKSNAENRPTNDKEWDDFQLRLMAVERIHRDEVPEGSDSYTYNFDESGRMIR